MNVGSMERKINKDCLNENETSPKVFKKLLCTLVVTIKKKILCANQIDLFLMRLAITHKLHWVTPPLSKCTSVSV